MKKTPINNLPDDTPEEIRAFLRGADIYDSSCSREAAVCFADKDGGYYLKISAKGTLEREAQMTEYFHKKGLGAEVLGYVSNDRDWLLTSAVPGEDCTHKIYISEPRKLCDIIAEKLRALHELDFHDCPIQKRLDEYVSYANNNYLVGNYDRSAFPNSFGYRSEKEAYTAFSEGKNELAADALIHGDYCLPNIMLDNWNFTGFIDLGNAGVADRHIDIFWGIWTLWFNLKTDRYTDRFMDAYGRDKIDKSKLRTVAAAEVFS